MKYIVSRRKKLGEIRISNLKMHPAIGKIVLVFISFAAGYSANQFAQTTVTSKASVSYQKPVFIPKQTSSQQPPSCPKQETISVCFTPNKKCQRKIINEINKARNTILVQAYSFTDKQIAQALVDASQRNVKVQILLDKSNRNSDVSAKNILVKHKLPLRFDSLSGIAHNKVMIIDESTVLSGSYNFSRAAYARNAENLIAIHDPELAQQYIQNWNK